MSQPQLVDLPAKQRTVHLVHTPWDIRAVRQPRENDQDVLNDAPIVYAISAQHEDGRSEYLGELHYYGAGWHPRFYQGFWYRRDVISNYIWHKMSINAALKQAGLNNLQLLLGRG